METADNKRTVQLINSGERLPRDKAEEAAQKIYTEFTWSPDYVEDLSRLSHAIRTSTDTAGSLYELLGTETVDRLEKHEYVKSLLGRTAVRLLIPAKVAAEMVVPDSEGGGYLEEPFVGQFIIPSLYEAYSEILEKGRQYEEWIIGQAS